MAIEYGIDSYPKWFIDLDGEADSNARFITDQFIAIIFGYASPVVEDGE